MINQRLMNQLLILLFAAVVVSSNYSNGYQYIRTPLARSVGTVVPWPKSIQFTSSDAGDYFTIQPNQFNLTGHVANSCAIIKRAIIRYQNLYIFDDSKPTTRLSSDGDDFGHQLGSLTQLELKDGGKPFECEYLPDANMDESYKLSIKEKEGGNIVGQLAANSTWGILRGLETFSQLVFNKDESLFAIRPVLVEDEPRFSHRGYLLDTARHYISLSKIMELLDAMSFNKLNVFHWHIVDDQSFPFVSDVFPQLSAKGSFRPNLIYTKADVKLIIQYAADRGIRVIPEIDSPGHTYSLRYLDNFLTKCYNTTSKKPNGDLGPVDPTKMSTFKTLAKLMGEFKSIFSDSYFHAGGDEVEFDCWQSNPEINDWMQQHNLTGNYLGLNNYYIHRVYDVLSYLNRTMVVWQEVFDHGASLPKDSVIHVWKYINDKPAYMAELKNVVGGGYKALLSSCWYLNYIDYGQDWIKFYQCDPTGEPILEHEGKLVLGGEVCMWSEFVDDTNVMTRTWPRASAAAERLWSPKNVTNIDNFLHRLEQIRCRMLSRNIQAEPVNGPGYC